MPHHLGRVYLLSPLAPAGGHFLEPQAACMDECPSYHPHYKGRQNTLATSCISILVPLNTSMKWTLYN